MKQKFKHLLQELSKRSIFVLSLLLIGFAVLLAWFLITGFSQSQTIIAIGVAALSAFFAAISAIAALMQAVETQRQRENLERPYIVPCFDSTNGGFSYFQIQNLGNSPAIDVVMQFTPEPIDYAGRKFNEISLFRLPISFVPPGKAYRQVIDASFRFLAEGKPTMFSVRIQYSSINGKLFVESTIFDLAYLKQSRLPQKTTEENLEDISKQLQEIKEILQAVKGNNSLLVETPNEYHNRLEKMAQQREDSPLWKIMLLGLFRRLTAIISR